MASIVKRKNIYSVVYNYINEHGESKQKWEKCANCKETLKPKAEIEHQQRTDTFVAPVKQTVEEFPNDFVALYSEKK